MTKSELLAKIDMLRGQGNQTDIAGVLADVLQEIYHPTALILQELPILENVSKEYAISHLGITSEEFNELVNGEYQVVVYGNARANCTFSRNDEESFGATYGGYGVSVMSFSVEIYYNKEDDLFSFLLNEV